MKEEKSLYLSSGAMFLSLISSFIFLVVPIFFLIYIILYFFISSFFFSTLFLLFYFNIAYWSLVFVILFFLVCFFCTKQDYFFSIYIHYLLMKYLILISKSIYDFFGFDTRKVVMSYIKLNNEYTLKKLSKKEKLNNSLILLPHCLQLDSCKIKITSDINNCKRCGKCGVSDLLTLSNKYNVTIFVATGGTLARKIVKDSKPDFILAVACQRDLVSGIRDTLGLPVIGVFNEMPYGPCFNTTVDIDIIQDMFSKILDNK